MNGSVPRVHGAEAVGALRSDVDEAASSGGVPVLGRRLYIWQMEPDIQCVPSAPWPRRFHGRSSSTTPYFQ